MLMRAVAEEWLRVWMVLGLAAAGILSLNPKLGAERAQRSLSIDSSVTIVEGLDEPAAVRRATEDLLSDFGKVFGQAPRMTDRLEDSGQVAILISGPKTPEYGRRCAVPTGTESFAFSVVHLGGHQVRDLICLTGADMRGTIYAIYQ